MNIRGLARYKELGWRWTVASGDREAAYHTDCYGDGLWKEGSYSGLWAHSYQDMQISGTCQFVLPCHNKNTAYQRIRRFFLPMYEEIS